MGHWLTRREKEKEVTGHQKYLALRIAVHLENYAVNCAKLMNLSDLFVSSREHEGQGLYNVPDFPDLPVAEDYKLLKAEILDNAFSLMNEVDVGKCL